MDADLGVVSLALFVVCVSAGPAPIARVTARISASVGIPVFCAVAFLHECLEVFAVSHVSSSSIVDFTRTDSLIVNSNPLCFSAGLIHGENPV